MLNEINSDKRLIDFWLYELEKPRIEPIVLSGVPTPTDKLYPPRPKLVQSSFFGWIMYLMLLILVAPSLGSAQNTLEAEQQPRVVGPVVRPQSIEMPDSWTAPRPIQVWNTGCCCDSNTIFLNRIYQNQEYIKIQNRPSTIKEIHETHFKSSSSLSDMLSR